MYGSRKNAHDTANLVDPVAAHRELLPRVVMDLHRDANLLEIVLALRCGAPIRGPPESPASSSATRMPMIAITTNTSTSVKPASRAQRVRMECSLANRVHGNAPFDERVQWSARWVGCGGLRWDESAHTLNCSVSWVNPMGEISPQFHGILLDRASALLPYSRSSRPTLRHAVAPICGKANALVHSESSQFRTSP